MKRIFAVVLTLLFVGGVLIVPTLHRVHCADNHDAHEVAKCAICQLDYTSIITTVLVIVPIVEFIKLGDAVLPQSFIPFAHLCSAAQARAPPVA